MLARDRAPRSRRPGRRAEHGAQGAGRSTASAGRCPVSAVAVPDRLQRGDLRAAHAPRAPGGGARADRCPPGAGPGPARAAARGAAGPDRRPRPADRRPAHGAAAAPAQRLQLRGDRRRPADDAARRAAQRFDRARQPRRVRPRPRCRLCVDPAHAGGREIAARCARSPCARICARASHAVPRRRGRAAGRARPHSSRCRSGSCSRRCGGCSRRPGRVSPTASAHR